MLAGNCWDESSGPDIRKSLSKSKLGLFTFSTICVAVRMIPFDIKGFCCFLVEATHFRATECGFAIGYQACLALVSKFGGN